MTIGDQILELLTTFDVRFNDATGHTVSWGGDMWVCDVEIDRDHTLTIYVEGCMIHDDEAA